jgi:hypothetical protein
MIVRSWEYAGRHTYVEGVNYFSSGIAFLLLCKNCAHNMLPFPNTFVLNYRRSKFLFSFQHCLTATRTIGPCFQNGSTGCVVPRNLGCSHRRTYARAPQ